MWSHSYPNILPSEAGCPVESPEQELNKAKYDYIIVGGGTAGCVLASRLSEDPGLSVLLLERGDIADTWMYQVPLISSDLFHSARPMVAINKSTPISGCNDRSVHIAQGEVLGGGSRVNSMIYTRGIPGEYEHWRNLGHPGWGYDDLLPYFKKSENSLSFPHDDSRGSNGPWINQTFTISPFSCVNHVPKASESIGIPYHSSYNSATVPSASCAAFDIFINQKMQRVSTYSAFLPADIAYKRKNHLKICTGAVATRVVFANSPGTPPRAEGVEFRARSDGDAGQTYVALATKEVIICCGAITSPQLLMLSGVGPASHLKELDIPVIYDNSGVGRHLKDHVHTALMWHVPIKDSVHRLKKPIVALWEKLKYIIAGKGLFGSSFVNYGIFLPSRLLNDKAEVTTSSAHDLDPNLPENRPDTEIMPCAVRASDPIPEVQFPEGLFSLMVCTLQPKSTGEIRLVSRSAFDRPHCQLNLLDHPDDMECAKKGVRLALRLIEEARAQKYPYRDFKVPESHSDRDIEAFVREVSKSTYQYSSSCRMASLDSPIPGVVDDELKVYGVHGLRICDASVFPEIPSCHLMGPVVVVAEKCADMIKALDSEGFY